MVSAAGMVPAALRCSPAIGVLAAWLTLWGSAALVAGPTAALLRSLRSGPSSLWALPLAVLLGLPALTVFGQVLHRTTHHRPLGAATFAVLGAVLLLGLVVVTTRLFAAAEAGKAGARVARATLVLAIVLALAVEMVLVHSALRQASGGFGPALLDGALIVLATVLGAALPVTRLPAWVGVAFWFGAVSACAVPLEWSPGVRAVVSDRAPVLVAVATSIFSGRP